MSTKRKIATLDVYWDETPGRDSTHVTGDLVTGHSELNIRPKADAQILGHEPTNGELRTIVAHELGHFVAEISGEISHRLADIPFAPPHIYQAAEKVAWDLGKEIYPESIQEVQDLAMNRSARVLGLEVPNETK